MYNRNTEVYVGAGSELVLKLCCRDGLWLYYVAMYSKSLCLPFLGRGSIVQVVAFQKDAQTIKDNLQIFRRTKVLVLTGRQQLKHALYALSCFTKEPHMRGNVSDIVGGGD